MTDRGAAHAPAVRIRYWAAARAAAGVADEVVHAATVAEALEIARARRAGHGGDGGEPRFDKVLSVCSFLLGEVPLGGRDHADVAITDGDTLDVLPPFAGGRF